MGSGKGITIKKLVKTLNKIVKFNFEFDTTKPAGYPKRLMDMKKTFKKLNFLPIFSLEEGLKNTWEWFKKNNDEFLNRKNYFRENEK